MDSLNCFRYDVSTIQNYEFTDEGYLRVKARIARTGRDATVVTYSAMLHEALAAAEDLSADGWEIEVIDLRSIKPLDTDTVLVSTDEMVVNYARSMGRSAEWFRPSNQ